MASILEIPLTSELFANLENGVQLVENNSVILERNFDGHAICPISFNNVQVGDNGYIIINCRCRIKKVFSDFLLNWIEINSKCPVCEIPLYLNRDLTDLPLQNSLIERIHAISFVTLAFTSLMITRAFIGAKPIIFTITSISTGYGALCGAFLTLYCALRYANEENPPDKIIKKAISLGSVAGAIFGLIGAVSIISAIEVPFQMLSILKYYLY